MLLAVLSDIHANLPALEAVLTDARRHRPDAYLFAGDMVGGPGNTEAIDCLRSLPGWMIRGNGDTYMVRLWQGDAPPEWRTRKQFAFMRWYASKLRDADFPFLAGLPEEQTVAVDGLAPIRLAHGSPGHPSGGVYPQRDRREIARALARVDEAVLIVGHTHEQWQAEVGGKLVLNPGAVCGPCDGTVGAQYALLAWREDRWQAELKKIDYNIVLVRQEFVDSGLLDRGEPLARAVIAGIETGVDVARALVEYAFALKDTQGFAGEPFVPDHIWDAAAASFDWQRYERGAQ